MQDSIRIGVSACLIGETVRYDGSHKLDRNLAALGRFFEWIPVCPEVECGLPVPREAMHLVGAPERPRLVTHKTRIDHTARMNKWTRKKLPELAGQDLCGFIFKSGSPSSGMQGVRVYNPAAKSVRMGRGLFAGAFMDRFPEVPVEDERRLRDHRRLASFIRRVIVFRRWKDLLRQRKTRHNLAEFHAVHSLLVMAHSPAHLRELSRLLADAHKYSATVLYDRYFATLMKALRLGATARKNRAVLEHIMRRLRKVLPGKEMERLSAAVEDYHRGRIPLSVPIGLANRYAVKYDESFLRKQYYLNPHPAEPVSGNRDRSSVHGRQ